MIIKVKVRSRLRCKRHGEGSRLAVLDDDTLEKIGDILASIGGRLEEVQNLLPLDHDNRITLLVEERDNRVLMHAVGFTLQLIDPCRELRTPSFFSRARRALL